MDFHRQIVTCLFSMLRLSFETQKVKENYAIFSEKGPVLFKKDPVLFGKRTYVFPTIHYNKLSAIIG